MHDFLQVLIIGLSIGATYALLALGYTMVYGVLRLINFAHGEVYMVGAVSGFHLINVALGWHTPLWLALAIAFLGSAVICGVLGYCIEFLAYRPLRGSPRLVILITAIGVSLLLQNVVQLKWIYGPTPRTFPAEVSGVLNASVGLGSTGLYVSRLTLLSFGLSVLLMIVLTWMILRTRTGLALRAVSHRFDTAMLMGVNTNRVISATFVLGSVLASVAGVMDGLRYTVTPLMGVTYGLKAFVAAVLGGIGSIPGALIGGLLIGITEEFARFYLPPQFSQYADAVAFVILILILLLKPTGIMGSTAVEKV
jgi:branched-chain amino acid transport system permease protein